jgi:hypothetical protein
MRSKRGEERLQGQELFEKGEGVRVVEGTRQAVVGIASWRQH